MDAILTASMAGTTIGIGKTAEKPLFLFLALSATEVLPIFAEKSDYFIEKKGKIL